MTDDLTRLGCVAWHSTEEDGGPDVGLSLGLGKDQTLWLGEATKKDTDAAGLASDAGWFLLLYDADETRVVASIVDQEAARDLFDRIAAFSSSAAREAALVAERDALRAELDVVRQGGPTNVNFGRWLRSRAEAARLSGQAETAPDTPLRGREGDG